MVRDFRVAIMSKSSMLAVVGGNKKESDKIETNRIRPMLPISHFLLADWSEKRRKISPMGKKRIKAVDINNG